VRTAIIVSCAEDQADLVRRRSAAERRTISAYVLNILMRRLGLEEPMRLSLRRRSAWQKPSRQPGPRTTFLVRCSVEEATRIKAAAAARGWTISSFVLDALERSWLASEMILTKAGFSSLRT